MRGRAPRTVAPAVAGAVVLALLVAAPAAELAAQQSQNHRIGVGTHFHGYDFDTGLGAEVANLLLIPVAYHAPVTDALNVDVYAAWAQGSVQRRQDDGRVLTHTLDGVTDAQIRASYQATPWALVTLSTNLPTGNSTHDSSEAIVASVLASDLLGFRESNWGTGFSLTPGVATATRFGEWGVGLGASYRATRSFEPEAGRSVEYEPGNETRIRLGVDRNVGEGGKFTAGITFQNFDTDTFGGRNLFQAGNRVRADATLAVRSGGSTWTFFGSNTWREEGDVTLRIVDARGQPVGDTITHTSSQNLAQVGVASSIPITSRYRVRPRVDLQIQTRDRVDGTAWMLGAGGDFPVRLYGLDFFPRARILTGSIVAPDGSSTGVWGGEIGGTVRWSP